MGNGRTFFDDLPTMDKKKATRMIVFGILIAIIFATIAMISTELSDQANSLYTLLNHQRLTNYNEGYITYEDYVRQGQELLELQYWLQAQDIILIPIARIGGFIAVLLIALGFLSLGLNDSIDEKSRRMYMIIGGITTLLLVMSVLGMTIAASIT